MVRKIEAYTSVRSSLLHFRDVRDLSTCSSLGDDIPNLRDGEIFQQQAVINNPKEFSETTQTICVKT